MGERFRKPARGAVVSWAIPCDYCEHIADSHDSYADTRADLAVHVHLNHPGKLLPGTWTIADVRSIPGVVARERCACWCHARVDLDLSCGCGCDHL